MYAASVPVSFSSCSLRIGLLSGLSAVLFVASSNAGRPGITTFSGRSGNSSKPKVMAPAMSIKPAWCETLASLSRVGLDFFVFLDTSTYISKYYAICQCSVIVPTPVMRGCLQAGQSGAYRRLCPAPRVCVHTYRRCCRGLRRASANRGSAGHIWASAPMPG